MTLPSINYEDVRADLVARRSAAIAQYDAAIAAIDAILGGGAPVPVEGSGGGDGAARPVVPPHKNGGASAAGAIPSDLFFGLTTASAVKKFLTMQKRPQQPRAIADALMAGGQVHAIDAKTAYTNVYTALKRGKDAEFAQTRSGEWGLAEWYKQGGKTDGE